MNITLKPSCFRPLLALLMAAVAAVGQAQVLPTPLSDIPLYSSNNVPSNLMLALSVEFPTGVVAAYTDNKIPLVYKDSSNTVRALYCQGRNSNGYGDCYSPQMNYLGYFDYQKCYSYNGQYFVPVNASGPVCGPTNWSGNMLNWASMTALDEFRKTLSGGYRVTTTGSTSPAVDINGDSTSLTVLQRSRQTAQGSASNSPTKQIGSGNPTCTTPAGYAGCAAATMAPSTVIGDAAFAGAANVYIRTHNGGTELTYGSDRGVFIEVADNTCFVKGTTTCGGKSGTYTDKLYYARVQVCVPGLLESNCNSAHASTDYPGAGVYNKPEGLIQQNYRRIRVGATGYLVAFGAPHPNGVLRALLRDNGPTMYNGAGPRTTNPNAEWDPNTGIFAANPDPDEVAASIGCGSSGSCVAPGNSVSGAASGAINYLNQFGLNEPGYETQDTIAELYWSTLAYYKKLPLDGTYTADNGAIQLDGFPAIANPSTVSGPGQDPIQYTCSGNAIVTIGDTHTWCDTRVPGSGLTAGGSCSNQAPLAAIPANGSDPGMTAANWVDAIGNLPLVEAAGSGSPTPSKTFDQFTGIGSLSTTYEFNDPPGATYNMAGMAYYAHTQNMRPDLTDGVPGKAGTKVTIDTYSVDVMEPGSYDGSANDPTFNPGGINSGASLGSGGGPNMYWLAAKYGGFDVDPNQCAEASPPTPCITIGGTQVPTPESVLNWDTNAGPSGTPSAVNGPSMRPDNYYQGNRPDLIQSGLTTIFNQVANKVPFSTGVLGLSSTRVLSNATAVYQTGGVTGFPAYQTTYVPGPWTGDVVGQLDVALAAGGTVTTAQSWHAQPQLDNLADGLPAAGSNPAVPPAWGTGRRIVTWNGSKGVPFRFSNLSVAEQADFPGDTSVSSPLLNFLRGDRSNEGTLFRIRRHVLGDIVDSGAVLVQNALSPGYSESSNPGYTAFATSVASRAPVVYAGANDGMMHAFAADFSKPTASNPFTGGGSELFAYVPSAVMPGPSLPATPLLNGMAALANLNGVSVNVFSHHFYVDSTPQVADVDLGWSCTTAGTACPRTDTAATSQWHTMLVGALGKGGRGLYALDITSVPPALDATSSSTQEPLIANKVMWEFTDPDMGFAYGDSGKPLLAKTAKYGWVVLATSGYDNASGVGHLYVISAKTGALLEKLNTTAGSPTNPSGLSSATAYLQSTSDGTIQQVYAGDLLGNVWRFDLSGTGAYPAPVLLATLTDGPTGNPQPITTAPRIENDVSLSGLSTRRWVFVGTGRYLDVSDISNSQQQTMYALRDGTLTNFATTGLPITRSVLMNDSNLATGFGTIPDASPGWYYDLPLAHSSPAGATERVIVDPDTVAGFSFVTWVTFVPTKDPCQPAGYLYGVNYGSGQTAFISGGGALSSVFSPTGYSSSQIVELPGASGGTITIIGQGVNGTITTQNPQNLSSNSVVRTNWREILN